MRRLLSFILLCQRVFRHRTHSTNATFLRAATKQRNATDQRPWKWHWLPGYQRLLWKLVIIFGPGLIVIWWFAHDADQRAAGGLALLCLIAAAVWMYTLNKVVGRKHNREVVAPLQVAVDHVLKEAA